MRFSEKSRQGDTGIFHSENDLDLWAVDEIIEMELEKEVGSVLIER